ncbi:MAG: signal recognition particle-docking protein FtsY [Deltaproteobacteria bacterium]|nr:signal recognition particle-docking protein FtsY [Deltaproteobacteria bacterium]
MDPEIILGLAATGIVLSGFGIWAFSKKRAKKPALSQEAQAVEKTLLKADLGAQVTESLLSNDKSAEAIKEEVQAVLDASLRWHDKKGVLGLESKDTPTVILFIGVNGVGKTTSIGKMAALLKREGKRVLLGAGDTFRAAAGEQLEIWAERTQSEFVFKPNADPASVLFDAVAKAKEEQIDFVLCDTAGRLHTKDNLMSELKKVYKVLGKALPGAPHEVFLVLDGTTGQNALTQAKEFMAAAPITGIVLTKLDGTAKGGIVVAIAKELQIPVRFVGVGERAEDLKPFDAKEFTEALFEG